jgi:transposase
MKRPGVSWELKNGYGRLVSKDSVYFMPQIPGDRAQLETMLGKEFAGVLSSDDFSVYNGGTITAQQKCLAHLRRHFKKVLGLPGNNNAAVAQIFLSLIDEAFIAHESWRKTRDLLTYHSWVQDFKIRLNQALATWLSLVGYAAGLLLTHIPQFWL